MSKRFVLSLFLLFVSFANRAFSENKTQQDSLSVILRTGDQRQREKHTISLFYKQFLETSVFDQNIGDIKRILHKYNPESAEELGYFAEMLIHRRKLEFDKAQIVAIKAIAIAREHNNDYLLYCFHLNMAYIQTDRGNDIGAVHNYRLARKQAEIIGDERCQVTADIGISDIYTQVQLYEQALTYLKQADAYCLKNPSDIKSAGYVACNKAEVYFRQGRADSLRFYISLIRNKYSTLKPAAIWLRRLGYFALILDKKFDQAMHIIKPLIESKAMYHKNTDRWYLAYCYYHAHEPDSAAAIAKQLLAKTDLNSPRIKLECLRLLSQIAEEKSDYKDAQYYSKLALTASEAQRNRVIRIADLSSEMRLDQMEASYMAKAVIYRKERTILAFAVIITALCLVVGGMSYYYVRQKHQYEKLLNQTKRRELAFINSHEVRRHLANILGICHLIAENESNKEELIVYSRYLLSSAHDMDECLKNVEQKLGEEETTAQP